MACRSLTFYTTQGIEAKTLLQDTEIVLTISSPPTGSRPSSSRPVVWKILKFKANEPAEQIVELNADRRISVASMVCDSDGAGFAAFSDCGVGLGPNQYITLSPSLRWTSNRLYDAPSGASFVVNGSGGRQTFSLGHGSSGAPFEAMVILKQLGPDEGLVIQHPCFLQAFSVQGLAAGQVFRSPAAGLITENGLPKPIDLRSLNENAGWHLYSGANGDPVLERAVLQCRSMTPSQPPSPISVAGSPQFEGALLTPPGSTPQLPDTPSAVGSPRFTWPLYTPPRTPELEPDTPTSSFSVGSPMFLSPLSPTYPSIFTTL